MILKFHHYGFAVNSENELYDFYSEILGLEIFREFTLDASLSVALFGINEELKVFQLKKEDIMFEVFIFDERKKMNLTHQCLIVNNRKEIIDKALKKDYPVLMVERPGRPLVFLSDRSGNRFEIKNIEV